MGRRATRGKIARGEEQAPSAQQLLHTGTSRLLRTPYKRGGGTSFLGHLKALGAPHILMSDMFRVSSLFWSRLVTATHHAKSVPTNDARPPREAGT